MMRSAVFLLLTPLLAAAQSDKCAIEGTVLNAKTREPIRKAEVVLRQEAWNGVVTAGVLTDAAGKFKFADIEPGRYDIWMSKSGFDQGPRHPGDAPHVLTLAAGQTLKALTYHLWPTSVIAGRVVDEDGNPMASVEIKAFRYRFEQGRPQVSLEGAAQTDDQGHYRMHGLRAGRYYLSATYTRTAAESMRTATGFYFADYARDEAYAPVYYPGITDGGQAAPIQLRAGEERRDVDFRLVPVRTVRVRGHTAPLPSDPQEPAVLMIMRGGTGATPLGANRMARVDEKGAFEVRGVFPGSYLLLGTSLGSDEPLSARQRLEVGNADVDGVEVTLRPPVEVKGRVTIEGHASQGLKPDNVYIVLTQEDAVLWDRNDGAEAEGDGSFTLPKLAVGVYRVSVSRIPRECYLKAVTHGGVDALAKGVTIGEAPPGVFDVLLSPNGGSVDGQVTGNDEKPASGATVVLVPEIKRSDLYKTATADQNGRFVLRAVAPGSYQLYAWDNLDPGAYEDPAFLEPYKNQAKKVSVEEKGRVAQDLPLLHAQSE
jgi:protocatechuate 3,4-dioxygenase beta subunit